MKITIHTKMKVIFKPHLMLWLSKFSVFVFKYGVNSKETLSLCLTKIDADKFKSFPKLKAGMILKLSVYFY